MVHFECDLLKHIWETTIHKQVVCTACLLVLINLDAFLKMSLDQLAFAPPLVGSLLGVLTITQGGGIEDIKKKLNKVIWLPTCGCVLTYIYILFILFTVNTHRYTHIHIHTCTHPHIHIHTHIHTHTHTHTHIHTLTNIHTYVHT